MYYCNYQPLLIELLNMAQPKTSLRKKWSARVTKTSNALDLEKNVFKLSSARAIALSLKRSATRSKRRKGTPFQSAMCMLNFYINRAGKNLSSTEKNKLENSKKELRKRFDK